MGWLLPDVTDNHSGAPLIGAFRAPPHGRGTVWVWVSLKFVPLQYHFCFASCFSFCLLLFLLLAHSPVCCPGTFQPLELLKWRAWMLSLQGQAVREIIPVLLTQKLVLLVCQLLFVWYVLAICVKLTVPIDFVERSEKGRRLIRQTYRSVDHVMIAWLIVITDDIISTETVVRSTPKLRGYRVTQQWELGPQQPAQRHPAYAGSCCCSPSTATTAAATTTTAAWPATNL